MCSLFLLVSLQLLPGQEDAAGDDPPESEPASAAGDSRQPEQLSPDEVQRRDIRTASFGELVAWAQRLGLSTRGSASDLRARLANHFGIELGEGGAESESEADGKTVIIESAEETRYFTLEEISQDYVRLRGGVTIRLEESDSNVRHHITADEVVFNRSRNLLSARGGVEYRIEREEGDELFKGESLNFFLDSWEGMFLRGSSTRTQTVEERELEFTYSGDYITRSPDDIVVLEDGEITSSEADPPNYHIAAKKIWIFGPGEWGLQSAVLHIGRVPVFYFPFFFRPGDKLFFHPALGYRNREGGYIQTTTYLVGQQEPDDEADLSFLQTEEQDEEGARVRDGLFLTRPGEGEEVEEPGEDTLKLLTDLYTKLGAYVGLEGRFSDLQLIDALNSAVGIGVSRPLYPAPNNSAVFTPYSVEDGEAEKHWDTTSFMGLSLPLRYKIDLEADFSLGSAQLGGKFELFSDPYVNSDFLVRKENIDWLELVRSAGQSEEAASVSAKDTLSWRLTGSITGEPERLSPIVERLSLERAEVSLDWLSRDVDPTTLPGYLTSFSGTAVVADRNPAERFYFPDSLVLPLLSASARGTLYSTEPSFLSEDDDDTASEDEDAADSEAAGESARPPWLADEPAPETDGESGESGAPQERERSERYKAPGEPLGSLSGIAFAEPLGAEVTYSLDPELRLDHTFDDEQWSRPEDAGFDTRYSSMTSSNDARVAYNLELYDGLFTWDATLDASAQYRALSNLSGSLEASEVESLENDARAFSSTELYHDLVLSSFPLLSAPRLSESRIRYRLDTLVFARRLNDQAVYESEWPEWNSEAIQRHSLESSLRLDLWRNQQTLSVLTDLPPLDPGISASLNLITGPVESTLSVKGTLPEGENQWEFDPTRFEQVLTVGEEVQLSHEVRYDARNQRVESFETAANAYFLSASFYMQQARGLAFEPNYATLGLSSPWVPEGAEELRPHELVFGIDFDRSSEPLWKNRLTLDAEVGSDLSMDLRQFTESNLSFTTSFGLQLHKFMELSFSAVTQNSRIYQYIPSLAEQTGRPSRNVFDDLWDSFRFGDTAARERSNFNLESISVDLLHHLGDWDLTVSYSGSPELFTDAVSGQSEYRWTPSLEVVIEWRPVSELRSEIGADDGEIRFGEQDS